MLGRQAGDEGGRKAAAFLAAELQRLGLRPMGDGGTYLQAVPFVRRTVSPGASLSIGDATFQPYTDFAFADLSPVTRSVNGATVVYGGAGGDDLLSADSAAGRVVALTLSQTLPFQELVRLVRGPFSRAAGVVLLGAYNVSPAQAASLRAGSLALPSADTSTGPMVIALGARMSRALVPEGTTPARGRVLGTMRGEARLVSSPSPAHNVVAVLPGSDPRLAGQYVAIGAHLDHVGTGTVVDHDSLRAFNTVVRPGGADDLGKRPTDADWPKVRAVLDSLRRLRPARRDSINNGADDDGSGSIGVLAVAEAFARAPVKPKRSILFVWHTAEELGLVGARWFTDHPTVPLDSIVAQINVDMIGRGMATDLPNGGPGYVQLIGSKRLSTQLGEIVETVGRQQPTPFTFDYTFDANGHESQYYCRSDHYMYARFGIPVVFLSTGGHRDYHMPTDEVQYIDFPKLARVSRLIHDIGLNVANLPQRVTVDGPKPDPNGQCRQ
jgi:hypothetical protein